MGQHDIKPIASRISVTNGTEKWFRVKCRAGETVSLQVSWSSASFAANAGAFYFSNWEDPDTPADAATAPNLEQWTADTSITTAAVTASAAGSAMYNLGNVSGKWLLFKIEPTATVASTLSIHAHVKD